MDRRSTSAVEGVNELWSVFVIPYEWLEYNQGANLAGYSNHECGIVDEYVAHIYSTGLPHESPTWSVAVPLQLLSPRIKIPPRCLKEGFPGKIFGLKFIPHQSYLFRFIPKSDSTPIRT